MSIEHASEPGTPRSGRQAAKVCPLLVPAAELADFLTAIQSGAFTVEVER